MTGTKEKLNRQLDQVNYEAQQAILNDRLSNTRKDWIVERAIEDIKRIGEERAQYDGGKTN